MKYAIDENQTKIEALPQRRGICICCNSEMIAKCGKFRINHWAHRNLSNCDYWWENETAWHRTWKDRFPDNWQENVKWDEGTGEKHIADVYNPGLPVVIEFQNSPIKHEEIQAREKFYGQMLWLLNGNKLNFTTMPLDDANEDFNRFKKKMKANAMKQYRAQKKQYEGTEIAPLENELEHLTNEFFKKHISGPRFLQMKKEINSKIEDCYMHLEKIKKDAENFIDELLLDSVIRIGNAKKELRSRYKIYNWRYKNPIWSSAQSPIFVDLNGELFYLRGKYLALTVPYSEFLAKYSGRTL